jgi:dihydroorotase
MYQGWFDSSVSLGEPGYEERETIVNGLSVAAKVALRLF